LLEEGEEVIATAGDADDPINNPELYGGVTTILGGQFSHFYCPNCNKRKGGLHCLAGRKKDEKGIVMVKDRCNNNHCECKCRRFYDYNGKLYKYGTEPIIITEKKNIRDQSDEFIDNLNDRFKKQNNVIVTEKTS